eukprot:5529650-Pyramimonas_sp.AAC.1
MEKLFDSGVPALLLQLALKVDYPPHLRYFGMLVHTSPRMLEVAGVVSQVIGTGKSILAGCSQSVPW